jgi:hypothetical protein
MVRHMKRDQGLYGTIIFKCFGGKRSRIFYLYSAVSGQSELETPVVNSMDFYVLEMTHFFEQLAVLCVPRMCQ